MPCKPYAMKRRHADSAPFSLAPLEIDIATRAGGPSPDVRQLRYSSQVPACSSRGVSYPPGSSVESITCTRTGTCIPGSSQRPEFSWALRHQPRSIIMNKHLYQDVEGHGRCIVPTVGQRIQITYGIVASAGIFCQPQTTRRRYWMHRPGRRH